MRSSLEASSSSLRAFSSRSKAARVALLAASETGSRSAIFLLTSCSSTLKSSLSIWASVATSRVRMRRCLRASRFSRSASIGAQLSSWRSSAMAGAALLRAARWFKRLRSLSCRSCARFSISFQFRMSTSSAGNLPASPSAISRSSTGAPRASSSCRRLTSSRGSPLQVGVNGGLQHRPQLLAALQDVGGHSECFLLSEKRLRRRKKLQRALSRRWLHTQICDLKAQPAHAAHQPQAARSQPNARGAVSQLGGAVRKRAAGVPEARVGRQLGFVQQPIESLMRPCRCERWRREAQCGGAGAASSSASSQGRWAI